MPINPIGQRKIHRSMSPGSEAGPRQPVLFLLAAQFLLSRLKDQSVIDLGPVCEDPPHTHPSLCHLAAPDQQSQPSQHAGGCRVHVTDQRRAARCVHALDRAPQSSQETWMIPSRALRKKNRSVTGWQRPAAASSSSAEMIRVIPESRLSLLPLIGRIRGIPSSQHKDPISTRRILIYRYLCSLSFLHLLPHIQIFVLFSY